MRLLDKCFVLAITTLYFSSNIKGSISLLELCFHAGLCFREHQRVVHCRQEGHSPQLVSYLCLSCLGSYMIGSREGLWMLIRAEDQDPVYHFGQHAVCKASRASLGLPLMNKLQSLRPAPPFPKSVGSGVSRSTPECIPLGFPSQGTHEDLAQTHFSPQAIYAASFVGSSAYRAGPSWFLLAALGSLERPYRQMLGYLCSRVQKNRENSISPLLPRHSTSRQSPRGTVPCESVL